jgi:hypothetical protein
MKGWPPSRVDHFVSMLTAGSDEPLSLEDVKQRLPGAHQAQKAAGALQDLAVQREHEPEQQQKKQRPLASGAPEYMGGDGILEASGSPGLPQCNPSIPDRRPDPPTAPQSGH